MKVCRLFLIGLLTVLSFGARAALTEFVPPNDTTGAVYSTGQNDGWDRGRGIVFQVTSNQVIDSIGLFHNLSGINLFYELAQVNLPLGQVTTGQTVLASGNSIVTTAGLEWVDFGIPDLLLSAGNYYHLQFAFSGVGMQNFFYNNNNRAFTEGAFARVEGTQGGDTRNSVMPALRLNTVDTQAVPEPTSLALLGLGIAGMFLSRRKIGA